MSAFLGGVKLNVETVEQFKILEFIKSNFDMNSIDLKLIDRFTIEVIDLKSDKITFKYQDGKIVYQVSFPKQPTMQPPCGAFEKLMNYISMFVGFWFKGIADRSEACQALNNKIKIDN